MASLHALHRHDLRHAATWPRRWRPSLLESLATMLGAIRTRRCLARLDDRMLKDIGLSRADALAEAGRSPWDLDPRRRGGR